MPNRSVIITKRLYRVAYLAAITGENTAIAQEIEALFHQTYGNKQVLFDEEVTAEELMKEVF